MGAFYDLIGASLGDILTPGVGLALPYITAGVSAGLSANEILRTLTGAGIGIRRSSGLGIIKALRTPAGFPPWLRGTSGAAYPSPDLFRVAVYPTSRNYTYVYTGTGTNPFTGLTETQHVSIVTDRLLTNDEAEAMAEAMLIGEQSGPALDQPVLTLETVKISPTYTL